MSQQSPLSIGHGLMKRRSVTIGTGALLLSPAVLPFFPRPARSQSRTAYDLIESARAVSIFAQIIKSHGFESEFSAQGNLGFFIPVDGAIERTPALMVERFRNDKEYARKVVLNHITDYGEMINGFSGGREGNQEVQQVKTKAGYSLTLVTGSGAPRIGGYPIIYTNIRASNGYCHAIDGVLQV